MFKIQINGQALDLNPGQQITLEEESNLFSDTLKADGSELISLAPTPRNLKALGHADVIEIEPLAETFPCLLTLGLNTYPATLKIQEVSPTGISCYVLYNLAALNCFGRNCRDFNWDTDNLYPDFLSQWSITASNYWPDTPYYFPIIINPTFYDDEDTPSVDKKEPFYQGHINKHEIISGSPTWLDNYVDGGTGDTVNRNVAVPMIPILELLKRAFLHDGYTMGGTFVNHPSIKKAFFYNNKSINQVALLANDQAMATNAIGYVTAFAYTKLNFTATSNASVFSTANDEFTIPSTGNFRFRLEFTIGTINNAIFLTEVVVVQNGSIIKNLTFSGGGLQPGTYSFDYTKLFSAPEVGQKIEFQMHAQGSAGTAGVRNIKLDVKKQYATPLHNAAPVVNLSAHAPDILFSELFNSVASAFQLDVAVNSTAKTIQLNFKKDALAINAPVNVNDAALLPFTSDWQKTQDVSFKWSNEQTEEVIAEEVLRQIVFRSTGEVDLYPTTIEGFDGKKVHPEICLLEQTGLDDPDLPNEFSLYINERGRCDVNNLDKAEDKLSIGFHERVSGWRLGTLFSPELNLLANNNLYSITQFHKPWHNFIQHSKRIFKVEVNPLHPQAHTLQPGQAIKLMHNTFLIQKLTRTYTATGLQKISLELRKV